MQSQLSRYRSLRSLKGFGLRQLGVMFSSSKPIREILSESSEKNKTSSPKMKLINSLSHQEQPEELDLPTNRPVYWYCCGPTVYSNTHIGHARTYVTFDAMRRVLEKVFSHKVEFILNITDIDDKIIKRSIEEEEDFTEIAITYEQEFFDCMEKLNVLQPSKTVRVSQHVEDVIKYTQTLIDRGVAYASEGSVYFDLEEFNKLGHRYRKLVPISKENFSHLESSEEHSSEKRGIADFVLWKKAKTDEPYWESPWGRGRPGWHIECSALIHSTLPAGQNLDIHSGGADLKFPHHDNEIALGEAHDCTSNWSRYFVHCSPLTIKGLKMSKSLKNFISVKEALKYATGRQLRLAFLSHHYMSPMNFCNEGTIVESKERDRLFEDFTLALLTEMSTSGTLLSADHQKSQHFEEFLNEIKQEIMSGFTNNLDTPLILSSLSKLAKRFLSITKAKVVLSKRTIETTSDYISFVMNDCLGLDYTSSRSQKSEEDKIIDVLIDFRTDILEAVRAKKYEQLFEICDILRDETLLNMGIKYEDGGLGWKRIDQSDIDFIKQERESEKQEVENIFESAKYKKFNIGEIGEDGLPKTDKNGMPFPPKVLARFARDLERHKNEQK